MNHKICVIGLGYVGLPLAVEFSKYYPTIGFDIDEIRIANLKNNNDKTGEVDKNQLVSTNLCYTSSIKDISNYNTYIVTVPTPIDGSKRPNLKALQNSSKTIGKVIKKNDIIIFESTVYPGCTREDCIPIIEKESGLKLNQDFYCGYSPERINPGDKKNTLTKITKIVSGSNDFSLELIDNLYSKILTDAETYPVSSIEVAEAAKVIENTQRDLNIAFVNELAVIFEKLNLNTNEVIDAASTKWNFIPYRPGLVGGHCIGVDPYYLTYKSNISGYTPEIISAGRRLNDSMGRYIAQRVLKRMISKSIIVEESKVLILGFTFKENCPDIRNTKVVDVISELKEYKVEVDVYDPWVTDDESIEEYKIKMKDDYYKSKYDAIILAVSHNEFLKIDFDSITHKKTIIFDIKSFLPKLKGLEVSQL
ncbi:MAG: Vi polysaccharide biosynthesis protein VipA/TviB [Candidatus Marinimicrobia bacterium]|nr:Vi polysaccharide biosynthesis protein VipA/TviB [Candidatus Neomarinimicrobiota bacterium]|tara:strand:+ start:23248 stop:24510 length:1263 start_codon:yes stop_codon:yes gene_type:complete